MPPKPEHCNRCRDKFARRQSLDDHILRRHANDAEYVRTIQSKIHQCDECDYRTTNTTNLASHKYCHHPENNIIPSRSIFECYHCSERFDTKENLQKHSKSCKAPKKPYQCIGCSIPYKTHFFFELHIVTKHQDNNNLVAFVQKKIYKCIWCNYATLGFTDIYTHIDMHSLNKNEKMNESYILVIRPEELLSEEDRYKKGISKIVYDVDLEAYDCQICGILYIDSADEHLLQDHSNDKEYLKSLTQAYYQCNLCKIAINIESEMKGHICVMHSNDIFMECY